MVSFDIRDRSKTIPCFDDGFPPRDSDGRITRRVSKPVWIQLDISCEQKVTDLEVKMTFDLDENSDVSLHHSKGAFFVTHLDLPIRDAAGVGEFEHKIDKHDARISINDWEFGSTPRLNLKFPKGNGCKDLSILVGFIGAVSNRRNANNLISANIEYRLIGENQTHFSSDFETGLTMRYEFKHDNPPRSTDFFTEIWSKHKVFTTDGDGNSIHPKQAMTIKGISKFIQRWKGEKNITIAYIGTDSTENISSLLRALKSSELTSKIGRLTIFYDEEWDEHQLYKIQGQEEKLVSVVEETELIKMVKNPNDDHNYNFFEHADHLNEDPIAIEPVDLIVSTYVAPWADQDDESRARYRNLITKLWIEKETALISVDPIDGANIFRSIPNGYFNIARLYRQELELTHTIEYVRMGSEKTYSVECMLYKQPKGGLAND